jgi:uncharacterized protein
MVLQMYQVGDEAVFVGRKGESMSASAKTNISENVTAMCEFVKILVQMIVDDRAAVVVVPVSGLGGHITCLEVRVNPDEIGKIIGKQGRTARSLRTIVAAAGMKQGQRFGVDIRETAL